VINYLVFFYQVLCFFGIYVLRAEEHLVESVEFPVGLAEVALEVLHGLLRCVREERGYQSRDDVTVPHGAVQLPASQLDDRHIVTKQINVYS